MPFLILVLVAGLWWWFYAPERQFVHGFAALLQDAETPQTILMRISGRRTVTGRFKDRLVMLQLVQPSDDRVGYLVLSMKADVPAGAPWKDSLLTSRDREIDRATFDLEGRYGLILTLDGGWFTATLTPAGVRFPGPFDPARWRNTLAQMFVVVEWMEKRARL